jgi:hypothetical protein
MCHLYLRDDMRIEKVKYYRGLAKYLYDNFKDYFKDAPLNYNTFRKTLYNKNKDIALLYDNENHIIGFLVYEIININGINVLHINYLCNTKPNPNLYRYLKSFFIREGFIQAVVYKRVKKNKIVAFKINYQGGK